MAILQLLLTNNDEEPYSLIKGVSKWPYSLIKGVDVCLYSLMKGDRIVAIGSEICYNSVVLCWKEVDYDISKAKNRRVFVKLEIA